MIRRAYLAWIALSVIVGYGGAYAVAIAYSGYVVEAAMAGFAWGVAWMAVQPWALRWVGRRLRG